MVIDDEIRDALAEAINLKTGLLGSPEFARELLVTDVRARVAFYDGLICGLEFVLQKMAAFDQTDQATKIV
jgi:hypothetical protein